MKLYLYTTLYNQGFKYSTYKSITDDKFLISISIFFDKNIILKILYKVSHKLCIYYSHGIYSRFNHEILWSILMVLFIRKGETSFFSIRMNAAMRFQKFLRGTVILDFSENMPGEYIDYYEMECIRVGVFNNNVSLLKKIAVKTIKSIEISDLIMVYSKEHSLILKNYYPNKRFYINHLPPELKINFKKISNKKPTNVYSVGQISILKGSHKLIEVWNNKEMDEINLYLIGDVQDCIIEYITKFGISKNIFFIKPYSIEKVFYEIVNNNGILCQPSLTEGVSRILINAVYTGIPIISTFIPNYLKINSYVYEIPIAIDTIKLKTSLINFMNSCAEIDYEELYISKLPLVDSKVFISNIRSLDEK